MTTITTPLRYTPADVARLSDQDGKLYELAAGNLVEKPMSTRANLISTKVAHLLMSSYSESRAYIFTEQPTYCFADPSTMRRPDVALVWVERMPQGVGDEELHIAPDLVVEVVSPTNRYTDLLGRVDEYLSAGVPIVWVVEPERRLLHVYRRDGSVALLRSGDAIRGETLLPGLDLNVSEFFPAAPAAASGP